MDQPWDRVYFSLDLVKSAIYHKDFLKLIDETKFSELDIKKAIYRYEKHWLPLCHKMFKNQYDLSKYYPPLDVAWIWHCHLLSPVDYRKDLEENFGTVVAHSCQSLDEMRFKQEQTVSLWTNETGLSFEHNQPNTVDALYESFRSEFSFDLFESNKRQNNFNYQVSLGHFRSKKFLKAALEKYKKFFYFIKKKYPEIDVVPSYAFDIIWHSHKLNPTEYNKDCCRILGRVFDLDESVNDRSKSSRFNTILYKTCQLWIRIFKEDFFLLGGMYRGPEPNEIEFITSDYLNLQDYFDKARCANFRIDELSLKNEKRILFFSLLRATAAKEIIISNEILTDKFETNGEIEFCENEDCFVLNFKLKEKFVEQLINVINEGHRSSSKNSIDLEINLEIPFNKEEITQEKTLNLNFEKLNLSCDLKYSIFNVKRKKLVKFIFLKNKFDKVDMLDIIEEYKSFDLKDRIQNEKYIVGFRARHSVTVRNDEIKVYNAEILHIPKLRWSSIRILYNGGCVASAHLIDSSQLPSPYQVESSFFSLYSCNEKALLVRDKNGDFAIIKASWQRKNREDVGYLVCKIFVLKNQSQVMLDINLLSKETIEFILLGLKVEISFRHGNVNLKNVESANNIDIERVLCIALGLSLLHVLFQPKPGLIIDDFELVECLNNRKNQINLIDIKKFSLLDVVGYYDLMKRNHLIHMSYQEIFYRPRRIYSFRSGGGYSSGGFSGGGYSSIVLSGGGSGGGGCDSGGGGCDSGGGGCGGGGCDSGGC